MAGVEQILISSCGRTNYSVAFLHMQQIDLEEEIVNLRVQNRFAAIRLQNIHDEIDAFMKMYYEAVGDLCLKFSEIEEKQKIYRKKINGTEEETQRIFVPVGAQQPRSRDESLEKEVKNLYRKLIKVTHPDVSEEKLKAAEYSRMVNEAYNQKNYEQLVKLDQLITSGNATKKDMVKQRNKLIDATFELKIQREQMLENPIYKLMTRFKEQDDNGKEMIAKIRKNLETKIATEKRTLMSLKLEYLEKIEARITT